MPPKSKTTGKGGKGHKRAKNGGPEEAQVKELVLRGVGQVYGKVSKMLGNGRISCKAYFDSGEKTIMCIIPGKFRKRMWISPEDIILISIRDYQDNKADVLYKYSVVEAKRLARLGEIALSESSIGDSHTDGDQSSNNNHFNDNIQWGGDDDKKTNPNENNFNSRSSYLPGIADNARRPADNKYNRSGQDRYLDSSLLPPSDLFEDESGIGNTEDVMKDIKSIHQPKEPIMSKEMEKHIKEMKRHLEITSMEQVEINLDDL